MNSPELLVFDIFGTVVDWHGGIAREAAALGLDTQTTSRFALAWRAGYQPAMQAVRSGQRPWARLDQLNREILDHILPDFGLDALDDAARVHLNGAWARLDPWPDSVAGLLRLKSRFLIATLSNGHIGLLTRMAKRGGLPWDCVLSAEVFRAYKPQPQAYRGAVEAFDLKPDQAMLVAAHQDDLAAARACGLQTAFIERPQEFGPDRAVDVSRVPANTWHARSLLDLADQLGC